MRNEYKPLFDIISILDNERKLKTLLDNKNNKREKEREKKKPRHEGDDPHVRECRLQSRFRAVDRLEKK